MSILVIDVGTSGLRAAVVATRRRPSPSSATASSSRDSPAPGLVEFDAAAMAAIALEVARAALAEAGPVEAVGITNQRASTIVWDRATGVPVGPGIGWQDLRTAGTCLVLQADGIRVAPNASATKAACLLDDADPDRTRDLCIGTVDTWLAWHLSEGAVHVTDATNAAVTGMLTGDASDWEDKVLDALRIPRSALPTVVDTLRGARHRHRPRRRAAHRQPRGRPAVEPRRPGGRAPGAWPRSPSAPAACSTSTSARSAPAFDRQGTGGLLPDRRLAQATA